MISAGDNIETDYTALWPNIPLLQDRTQELIDSNHLDDDAKQMLLGFSEALITEFANCNPENKDVSIQCIKQIEKNFDAALDTDNFKRYIKDFSTRNLNSFGNEVSIVFHNQNNLTDLNILFTGDSGDGCSSTNGKNYVFDTLANNRDLYQYYKAIKLPHHGTPSYFSFELCNRLAINAPYLLMSNGSLKKTFLNHLPTIAYYDYCKLKITNALIIRSDDFGTLLKRTINI